MNERVCNFCQESGHKKADCEEYAKSFAQHQFAEYAHEILEGRKTMLEDSLIPASTPDCENGSLVSTRERA